MSTNDSDSVTAAPTRRSKRLSILGNNPNRVKMARFDFAEESIESDDESEIMNDEKLDNENQNRLCENCGKKLRSKLKTLCSTCAPPDDSVENKCEHCKDNTVSQERKMIRCLVCSKCYHVDCLLPADLPSNIKFEKNKFMKGNLGCISCNAVLLCYKIQDIITWRWRKDALTVKDPHKYFMPREYFVRYKLMSYWDSEWITEIQLDMSEHLRYQLYRYRKDLSTPPPIIELSEVHKRKMNQNEIDLHEKYFQWGIEYDWMQPQRVMEVDDVGCIVKWRGLNYDNLSTEPLTRVDQIFGLQEAIDFHKNLKEELFNDDNRSVNRSKLTKLTESPDYLGPLLGTANSKPKLHPYQLEGLNWLRSSYSNNVNTILADEMGLGKTIQAIAFLYSLRRDKVSIGPFLVVAPLSTLKNWEREFEFWAPELSILTYAGDKDSRIAMKDYFYFTKNKKKVPSFHVLLTNYEFIYLDDTFLHSIHWEVLIIDEAHRIKNIQSRLFKSLTKYKIKYRNLMTGTPLQNNLEELYSLLNFMDEQSFGNMTEFLEQFHDVSKEEQVKNLQVMLKKHLLRRLKTDVMKNLPSKEEQLVRLELSPMQKEYYKIILEKNYEVLSGKFMGTRMANILMHLRKVCNHPYLMMIGEHDPMREDGTYDVTALVAASSKMEMLEKMLKKLRHTGHRVLIFSGMTKLLDIIEHMLEGNEIQYERIDGNVSSGSRQEAIDRFNEPDSKSLVFLLSTKAGGLGINLSSADTVIIYDSDWNPHNDLQALSRAHRIGQLRKVMIYRFVTRNTIEEKIMETAKRKMMVSHLVVKSYTKTEYHQILSFGTKELFDENAADDQKITYDDAAIETLLNRNRSIEEVTVGGDLLDMCFSGFKVADCQFETDIQEVESKPEDSTHIEPIDETNGENPKEYWDNLLGDVVRQKKAEESLKPAPQLGKGLRIKKKILPLEANKKRGYDNLSDGSDAANDGKDAGDTEYEVSGDEGQDQSTTTDEDFDENCLDNHLEKKVFTTLDFGRPTEKYVMDKDFRRLVCHGIDSELAKQSMVSSGGSDRHLEKYNRFCIVDGFYPVERMDIYNALMNYGLPPKVLRRSDYWWPPTLAHKTSNEMQRYIGTLMRNIVECNDQSQFSDGIPKDNIDYDLLLARIGLNGLIAFKVNQYEVQNKVILELLTYKQYDILTQSIDEIKTIFDDMKDRVFEFNIFDGEFTKIHSLWSEYESKIAGDASNNLIFEWNKLHDYFLLSAMALYGYDNYLDQIFLDPQFHLLFVPSKLQNLDLEKNNFEIRKFVRARQVVLENALLIEAQLTKISCTFDVNPVEGFTIDKLKYYHDFFVKQNGTYYVSQGFANTRLKLKAITQLELLINDIDCASDSYRPIEVRKMDS